MSNLTETPTQMTPVSLAIATVYMTAFLQGLAMVSFPASATLFKELKGFSDAQYGLIFIPQIITTIAGSLAGGSLARTLGLKRLLAVALIATGLSQLGLNLAVESIPAGPAFYVVLCCTAIFGLAFGIGAAPLNTYPGLLFPEKSDSALVALHTLLGIGLAVGPLLVGPLTKAGAWVVYPALGIIMAAILLIGLRLSELPAYEPAMSESASLTLESADSHQDNPLVSFTLWIFVGIVILYAFAEGTFANWCIIYLNEERGIDLTQASLALSVFWAALAGGRLLVSVLLLKIKAQWIWLVLPILMIGTFLLLPAAHSAITGIALFGLAGFSCSAFFPLSVGIVSKRFPASSAMVSSFMIASLMIGVGTGTFVIGPLRSNLPLEQLYQYSALYPLSVFVLAAVILAGQKAAIMDRACRMVFGRPCSN
jgi:fucose permease